MNQTNIFDICHNKHKGNKSSVQANPKRESKIITQMAIVLLLAENGSLTGKEIAHLLSKPFNAISGRLSELKAANKIKGTGRRFDGSEYLELVK